MTMKVLQIFKRWLKMLRIKSLVWQQILEKRRAIDKRHRLSKDSSLKRSKERRLLKEAPQKAVLSRINAIQKERA